MKRLIGIMFLVFSVSTLSYSQIYKSDDSAWEWNSHGMFDYGFTHWSSDLGAHTNFTTGLNGLLYNVADENSPIVLDGRVYFSQFLGEDATSRINRQLLGVSVGAGIHAYDRLFATVNVGHLWVMNEVDGETELSSLLASGKLMAVILRMPQNWNLIVNLEGGMTFQDIEFRDPGVNANGNSPDRFNGTGFVRMTFGFSYNIGMTK